MSRVQRSVTSIVKLLVRDSSSFITSPRVIVNHTPSARVIIVFDNYFYYLHLIIFVVLEKEDRVIKFSIDAGFLTTVEVGQYFMMKDTEEFSQLTDSMACREYTLPRDENSSEPNGWIRVSTKIGPVSSYNLLPTR